MKKINISNLMTDSGVGFGTSGARGLVEKMTDEVCYAYTRAFLQYLHSAEHVGSTSLEPTYKSAVGQIKQGGSDNASVGSTSLEPAYKSTVGQLKQSGSDNASVGSTSLEPAYDGDDESSIVARIKEQSDGSDNKIKIAIAGDLRPSTPRIMTAVSKAAQDMGIEVINGGFIPSPAVALYGIRHQLSSIMVTGSHIPDDRNGIKFNTAAGEISKEDEQGIREQTVEIEEDLFDEQGMYIQQPGLPDINRSPETEYLNRYIDLFGSEALKGMTIGVYQHSGVARDLITHLLAELGAKVIALGRSETFVPVDTEAIREEDIALARQWASENQLDAIVSTDGDADRPLISDEKGNWLRGDGVGPLCAKFLGASHVVTPVSSNTAVDLSGWFEMVERTRIGSPYVIAGMEALQTKGKKGIVGYEANGGFLQQDDIEINGKTLSALPTRDAVIVILSILLSAKSQGLKVSELVAQLPERYTCSDRIKQIPTDKSQVLIASLNTGDEEADSQAISEFFEDQFGEVSKINRTDGLRITFGNGGIVHLRPSGNAPELRCYTESGTLENAVAINQQAMRVIQKNVS